MTDQQRLLKDISISLFGDVLAVLREVRTKELLKAQAEDPNYLNQDLKHYETGYYMAITACAVLAKELSQYDFPVDMDAAQLATMCRNIMNQSEQNSLRHWADQAETPA